ncbi:MAG: carboxypeptidase M32, partial [candidate division Zixibacteria bacterium]|nr:carboxypeptidase M32 [candidate division Zixibacteria bacterium]
MTNDPKKVYEKLLGLIREASLLRSSMAILEWDERTYLPKGGSEHRANQLALLAGMVHDKATSPEIGDLLKQLGGSSYLSDEDTFEAANVREIKHFYDKAIKIPKSLVEELARVTSIAHGVWVEARKKSDFSLFLPHL